MRIVGREEVKKCMSKHADSRRPLQSWLSEVAAARWTSAQDVLDRYPRTSFIRQGLAVFDIKGNDYRLAAQISFKHGVIRVLKVGTHAEYDTWAL